MTIADTGSYRQAARQLYTAQPALSVSIRKLEASLGVQLFIRSSRGVTLTPAGGVFLKDAESTSIDIIEMLREKKLDIGIVRRPPEFTPDIDFVDVQPDDLIAALPCTHPLAQQEQIDLVALRDEPFIVFSRNSVPGLWALIHETCRSAGFTPRVAQATTQALTMIGLVGSRLGVALVPGVIAQYSTPPVSFVKLANPQTHQCLMLSIATSTDGASQTALKLRSFLAGQAPATR